MLPCPGLLRRADPPVLAGASSGAPERAARPPYEDEDLEVLLIEPARPRMPLGQGDEALDARASPLFRARQLLGPSDSASAAAPKGSTRVAVLGTGGDLRLADTLGLAAACRDRCCHGCVCE